MQKFGKILALIIILGFVGLIIFTATQYYINNGNMQEAGKVIEEEYTEPSSVNLVDKAFEPKYKVNADIISDNKAVRTAYISDVGMNMVVTFIQEQGDLSFYYDEATTNNDTIGLCNTLDRQVGCITFSIDKTLKRNYTEQFEYTSKLGLVVKGYKQFNNTDKFKYKYLLTSFSSTTGITSEENLLVEISIDDLDTIQRFLDNLNVGVSDEMATYCDYQKEITNTPLTIKDMNENTSGNYYLYGIKQKRNDTEVNSIVITDNETEVGSIFTGKEVDTSKRTSSEEQSLTTKEDKLVKYVSWVEKSNGQKLYCYDIWNVEGIGKIDDVVFIMNDKRTFKDIAEYLVWEDQEDNTNG